MNRPILHKLAVRLLWGFPAFAAEVVVVQGERMAPFEAALRGFEATAGVRSVERFVLSDLRGADVARTVHDKLVSRHPHVFGDVAAADAAAVVRNWEQLKQAEKGRPSVMDGIPAALPALPRTLTPTESSNSKARPTLAWIPIPTP